MMIALTAVALLASGAAELRSEAWVVISQRSSVSKGTALDLAKDLSKKFTAAGIPNPTPVEDQSTACANKMPCLVAAARAKGVGVLITLELGSALEDLLVRAAAVSVDEDGRVLQRADLDGPAASIKAALKEKVVDMFAPT